MTTAPTPVSRAEQALAVAKTPRESKAVEAMAAAAKAWARENDDFEKVVEAARIYILARRKTTELSVPFAPKHGGDRGKNQYAVWQADGPVDLANQDFGFTEKQWSRRLKELEEVKPDDIDSYIDDCIEKHVEPTVFGLLRFALQIIGDSTGNEWWTPPQYADSAHIVMGGIDLDPASCPEANAVIGAKTYFTEADNGLLQPWHGRVWLNPPYSANKEFAQKMLDEVSKGNVQEAVVLLGAHAIETQWFAPYWNFVLCFTGHRIKFNTPTGPAVAGNIAGSVFVYLGEQQRKFADEFAKHGFTVKRWP
jgi:phage N-6-adenine-methyltransferase